MDGINPLISGHHPSITYHKKEQKKLEKSGKTSFRGMVEKKETKENTPIEHSPETLKDLELWVDEIFSMGETLKKDPTLNSLKPYRETVGRFLRFVVSEGYQIIRNKGIINPRTFKQKEFVNVDVINSKLESLAAYVLTSQKEQLEILRRVDEINGMIVDYIG